MAFNVDQFRQAMVYDGARPNLFQVILDFPSLVNSTNTTVPFGDGRKLSFMASGTQLPASNIGVVRQMYFGREVKFPGNRVFQDWSINIINDESFDLRNSFEQWMNLINNHHGNVRDAGMVNSGASGYTGASGFPGASGYSVPATVIQFNKDGSSSKYYDFVGLFPIQVDPINLSWGLNDQIEEFGVTFSYQYWESNTTLDSVNAASASNQ